MKVIYGEPIAAHGKTVIPVAKIMYGYGAGAGTGGVWAIPVRVARAGAAVEEYGLFALGVIEVSDQQTRFVPITDGKRMARAVLAGVGLGMLLAWAQEAQKPHLCRFCHWVSRSLFGQGLLQDSEWVSSVACPIAPNFETSATPALKNRLPSFVARNPASKSRPASDFTT